MTSLWFRILSLFHLPAKKVGIEKTYVLESILKKFNSLYPLSYNTHWFLKKGTYEVSYFVEGSQRYTLFRRNGDIIREYKSVSVDKFPKEVISNMIENLEGYQICDILWDEFNNEPHFKATFKKNKQFIEAEYDSEGHEFGRIY